jgi:hypothetical protein
MKEQSVTDEEYAEHCRRRDERSAQMKRNMDELMADDVEYPSLLKEHPLPWTWVVTYYDGVGIQFRDANDRPVLPGFIYDEEVAADIAEDLELAA